MTRKDLLENALHRIAQRAGLDESRSFRVKQVSPDGEGLYLLELDLPASESVCEALGREVPDFPGDGQSTCIALLPHVVDRIIASAQPRLCARHVP